MTKEEVINKISEVIEEVTDIPTSDIHADSILTDDLELSSLEVMTSIAEIEKAFHIRLKESELMKIVTVDDVAQCVMQKI